MAEITSESFERSNLSQRTRMEVWKGKMPHAKQNLSQIVSLRIERRGRPLGKGLLRLLSSCTNLRYLELDSAFLEAGDLSTVSSLNLDFLCIKACRWKGTTSITSWKELRVNRLFLDRLRDFELSTFFHSPPSALNELRLNGSLAVGAHLLHIVSLPLKYLRLEMTIWIHLSLEDLAYLYTHLQVETLYVEIGPLAYHHAIALNTSLTDLTLRGSFAGEQTWQFNSSLTKLDLNENMLVHVAHLFALPSLNALSLSHNMIPTLGEANSELTRNTTLTSLNLTFNRLGSNSLIALHDNKAIRHLDISHNALRDIDLAPLVHSNVEHLSLLGNYIQNPYWALALNQSITTYTECNDTAFSPTCLCNLAIRNKALQSTVKEH